MSFALHSQLVGLTGILPPRKVSTPLRHLSVNPAIREEVDALADYWLRVEQQRKLDEAAENQTEGRIIFHRFDRSGEVRP